MPRRPTKTTTTKFFPILNQARLALKEGRSLASMKALADHLNGWIPPEYHPAENGAFREYSMYAWTYGTRQPPVILLDVLAQRTPPESWERRFAETMRQAATSA